MTRPWSSWLIKYSDELVASWRDRILAGESQRSIAQGLGVERSTLHRAVYYRAGGAEFQQKYYAYKRECKRTGLSMWQVKKRQDNEQHSIG